MREIVTTIRMHILNTNLGNVNQIRRHLAELYMLLLVRLFACDIPCVYQALYLSLTYLKCAINCLLSGASRSR